MGFCVEKGNYGASGESGRPITASIGHESNVQSTAPLPNQAAPLLPAEQASYSIFRNFRHTGEAWSNT